MKQFEKDVMTLRQEIVENIPVNEVLNLLIETFETSAINYWGVIHIGFSNPRQGDIDNAIELIQDTNVEKFGETLTDGELFATLIYNYDFSFKIYDVESSNNKVLGLLNWVSFFAALGDYAKFKGKTIKAVVDNYDADVIDGVIQFALFGNIIYG